MRDVIALENVEPKKKKGTLAKTAGRGEGLAGRAAGGELNSSKIY